MTLWTAACQAPLSTGLSRAEHCGGGPFPPPGDLPHPGVGPGLPHGRQSLYQLSHQGRPGRKAQPRRKFRVSLCQDGALPQGRETGQRCAAPTRLWRRPGRQASDAAGPDGLHFGRLDPRSHSRQCRSLISPALIRRGLMQWGRSPPSPCPSALTLVDSSEHRLTGPQGSHPSPARLPAQGLAVCPGRVAGAPRGWEGTAGQQDRVACPPALPVHSEGPQKGLLAPLGTPAREKYQVSGLSFVPKRNGRPAFGGQEDTAGGVRVPAEPALQASPPSLSPQREDPTGEGGAGAPGAQPPSRARSRAGPAVVGGQDEEEPCPGEGRGWEGEAAVPGTGPEGALSWQPLGPLVPAGGTDRPRD